MSAAELPADDIMVENETIAPLHIFGFNVVKSGVVVTFYFDYKDGSSAELVGTFLVDAPDYDMPNRPTSYFSGDTCYATVVVKHKNTGAQITFNAWCDIYGDYGAN